MTVYGLNLADFISFYWKTAFVYILFMTAFTMQLQSWAVVTEILWGPQSQEYLLSELLQKKFSDFCFALLNIVMITALKFLSAIQHMGHLKISL